MLKLHPCMLSQKLSFPLIPVMMLAMGGEATLLAACRVQRWTGTQPAALAGKWTRAGYVTVLQRP